MMFAGRVRILTASLWAGSLWTVGYLVAPTLFATLVDRSLAGTIAGNLFRIEAWLSVVCALILIVLIMFWTADESMRKRLLWLVAGMLACTLIGYFALHPFMAALRESAGTDGVMDSAARTKFGILHGVSSAFYLVQSLLAAVLVLKAR